MTDGDRISGLFYLLFECAIFAAPVCGAIFLPRYKQWPQPHRRAFFGITALFLLGASIIVFTRWSFRGIITDATFLFITYFAYCALVFALSTYRPRWLTYSLSFIGILPMAAALFLGTIGLLGIFMVLGDIVPVREGKLPNRMEYRVTYHGGATEAHNESVITIVRSPRFLPFVEERIFSKRYIDTDCDVDLVSARVSPDGHSVEVMCGTGRLDSVVAHESDAPHYSK